MCHCQSLLLDMRRNCLIALAKNGSTNTNRGIKQRSKSEAKQQQQQKQQKQIFKYITYLDIVISIGRRYLMFRNLFDFILHTSIVECLLKIISTFDSCWRSVYLFIFILAHLRLYTPKMRTLIVCSVDTSYGYYLSVWLAYHRMDS